jgi:hypothetical protein
MGFKSGFKGLTCLPVTLTLFQSVFSNNDCGAMRKVLSKSTTDLNLTRFVMFTGALSLITERVQYVHRTFNYRTPTRKGRVASRYSDWATGWTVRGSKPGVGEILRTCPDRPWGPPSLLYNGRRVFPGGKERPGRDIDPSPPSSAVVKKW